MVQPVWSTAHGRPLEVTNGATGEQMTRLGQHVDPILALLTPLWVVAPTPLTLVAVQVVAVSLGALPVYWLARRHLSRSAWPRSSPSDTSHIRGRLDGGGRVPPRDAGDPLPPALRLVSRLRSARPVRDLRKSSLHRPESHGARRRSAGRLVRPCPGAPSDRGRDRGARRSLDGDRALVVGRLSRAARVCSMAHTRTWEGLLSG